MYIIYYKVAQVITLFVSISTLAWVLQKGKIKKEFKFVLSVEICTYLAFIFIPTEYLTVEGKVPLFRYLSWILTCPIMLFNLLHVNNVKKMEAFMDVIIMDLIIIICGIIAAFSIIWIKLVFFFLAGGIYIYLCYYMYNLCSDKKMILIFFASWTIFPIFFLLGPEGFGVIDIGNSLLLHAIADLISKNLCGLYINKKKRKMEKEPSKEPSKGLERKDSEMTFSRQSSESTLSRQNSEKDVEEALTDIEFNRNLFKLFQGMNYSASSPRIIKKNLSVGNDKFDG